MNFEEKVLRGLDRMMGRKDLSQAEMERSTGAAQSSISRWVKRQSSPQINKIGPVLDWLGATLVWPDEVPPQIVVHVEGGRPNQSWRAVPIVERSFLAQRKRRAITPDDVVGHVIRKSTHDSVAGRQAVVAMRVAGDRDAMSPTVEPGDTVLIDLGARNHTGDDVVLFCDPGGDARLCRVTVAGSGAATVFLVRTDGRPTKTESYALADFGGRDVDDIVRGVLVGIER